MCVCEREREERESIYVYIVICNNTAVTDTRANCNTIVHDICGTKCNTIVVTVFLFWSNPGNGTKSNNTTPLPNVILWLVTALNVVLSW